MAIEVEELIIQPFREVVERGKEAVANAQAAIDADIEESNSQDLQNILKSAQSLVREGERGLQRLLPLWKERLDKYGEAFTEAMRHNGKSRLLTLHSSISFFRLNIIFRAKTMKILLTLNL